MLSILAALLLAPVGGAAPESGSNAIVVDRDELMQLCLNFRYNAFLIAKDSHDRELEGDHTGFMALMGGGRPCDEVGIDVDAVDGAGKAPNIDLTVEKQRIAAKSG